MGRSATPAPRKGPCGDRSSGQRGIAQPAEIPDAGCRGAQAACPEVTADSDLVLTGRQAKQLTWEQIGLMVS